VSADTAAARDRYHEEVAARIRVRLDEVMREDDVDPARRGLTAWDWLAIIGFFVLCSVVAVAWGY